MRQHYVKYRVKMILNEHRLNVELQNWYRKLAWSSSNYCPFVALGIFIFKSLYEEIQNSPPPLPPTLFNVEWLLMKRDSRCV